MPVFDWCGGTPHAFHLAHLRMPGAAAAEVVDLDASAALLVLRLAAPALILLADAMMLPFEAVVHM